MNSLMMVLLQAGRILPLQGGPPAWGETERPDPHPRENLLEQPWWHTALQFLSWGMWAVALICLGSLLVAIGKMVMSEGGIDPEQTKKLAYPMVACVIAGAALQISLAVI